MSRSGDERRLARGAGRAGPTRRPRACRYRLRIHRRHARLLRLGLTGPLLALVAAAAAAAQGVPATPAPDLTPRVQESLLRLQEGWLQWTGAFYAGDAERAREVVEDLLSTAEHLGMRRLPDLSTGALVQAVDSAREGEAQRAVLALEAAERLDPGRPETAFAAAELARLAGDWPSAVLEEARGYLRVPGMGLEWQLARHDLLLWLLASLLLAAALFVALEMGVRGPALIRGVTGMLERRAALPRPVALVGTAALLLWPLALPAGLLWLALYWSLLLWGYLGTSERLVVAVGWLLLAATPVVVEEARERVALALSPPVRALESAARGRLYGGLFTDLGVLPGALPNLPAVDHFLADLNVRLGQWDEARLRYEAVLEDEPENAAALVNLGAYYYHRGDYGNAVALFRQASSLAGDAPVGAAAHFDLSVAYTASYLFDEHREALLEARRIDDLQVTRWLRRPERQRIVTVEGGMARIPEIERALRSEWSAPDEASPGLELLRRARPALLIVLLASLAIAYHGVTGSGRRTAGDAAAARAAASGRWPPVLVPGLPSAAAGRGASAFGALLAVSVPLLALLAAGVRLGYPVPWRYDPGGWLLPALATLALALVLGVRALRVARSS